MSSFDTFVKKVHETQSGEEEKMVTKKHKPVGEEERMVTKKHKPVERKGNETEYSQKNKAKSDNDDGEANVKSTAEIAAEFEKFCKAISEHLSVKQMREILEKNGQDNSGCDDAVVPRCQDMLFYGTLGKCPVCENNLECSGDTYSCTGSFSEWSTCVFTTRDPPRIGESIRFPEFVQESPVFDLLKKHQDPKSRPRREVASTDKPFAGMTVSLSGRLSWTHEYWMREIEKHGGKFANSVIGATCLVVSPTERGLGASFKVAETVERGIPVVSEAWLVDSIEKQEPQPLDAYDVLSDLAIYGRGIPWDKQDPDEEALESISAELKVYGKRGVHKDTRLEEKGGKIFEKDGILFNCAFSVSDMGRQVNEYCITQLVMVPENHLHMYYKKGRVGDNPRAEERLEERNNVDSAVKEFVRLFEELTGNEFEQWEREKKFQKKSRKFYPIDMDDGYDVRHGGLGLRQLESAAAHCKLDPKVANFMKVLCGQDIYRYAFMEMGLDAPDLPMGMLSNVHLKRIHRASESNEGDRAEGWGYMVRLQPKMVYHDALPRPLIFRDYEDLADHAAAALECVRDITVASHLIGDMTGGTIDDPLFDRYKKLGCSIIPLEKDSEDYKMIVNYLENTYEPVKVGDISYGVSVDNIFAVEVSVGPSYDEIKKLPNKVLLWCGSRSSNLLRHLHKGFLPAICSLPVPGYMFGSAIVCSDAAAAAARYGFTAVERPDGFLVLAVASLGEQIAEFTSPPEDTKSLEEKKLGVKGLGRKKTEESEHFVWKDEIKVPCGRLIPSQHKDSPLEYNEYAVYDPKQVSIRFLVGVKYEEKDVVYAA